LFLSEAQKEKTQRLSAAMYLVATQSARCKKKNKVVGFDFVLFTVQKTFQWEIEHNFGREEKRKEKKRNKLKLKKET
jgi:hypothetical protein